MEKEMIKIDHLVKSFGDHHVLKDITLSFNRGEVVSIIGSSGSGKSTLLRSINLLEEPTSGDIIIDGKSVVKGEMDKKELARRVGMVFQSFNLFENMSVLKNCMVGPVNVLKKDKATAEQNAMKYLKMVGMGQYINARPSQLSGGQKQRVAIARALAMEPECLLFDEPTSALDPEMVGEVLDVIRNLAKTGLTMVIVTHEMQFAKEISDRVIFIDEGLVAEDKPCKEFFSHIEKERVASFLKRMNH